VERFEERRIARAPIACCWEVLIDPDRAPEWVPFVSEAAVEGPPGVGRRLIVTGSLLGVSMDTSQVVDIWEEPDRYGWCTDRPFPTRLRVALAAIDQHATDITAAIEADVGPLAAIGARLANRTIRKQFGRSADRLVSLTEDLARQAPPGPGDDGTA
jgi:carbon monoxide dehydrogenase subunit G